MRQNTPTPKEIEVLQAIAVHGTIAAAARSLYISPHTVDAHLDHLRDKSGCRYLTQMIAWAAVNGWLRSEDVLTTEITQRAPRLGEVHGES